MPSYVASLPIFIGIFVCALALGAMVIFVQAVVRISHSLALMSKAIQDLAATLRVRDS